MFTFLKAETTSVHLSFARGVTRTRHVCPLAPYRAGLRLLSVDVRHVKFNVLRLRVCVGINHTYWAVPTFYGRVNA